MRFFRYPNMLLELTQLQLTMYISVWSPILSILRKSSSCRSFNLVRHFEPEKLNGVGNNYRNNRLPKSYERMMQPIFHRLGPPNFFRSKINTILLSRRERKMSESVRMSTPEGRALVFKRLIDRRRSLWPHA
uniref:Uncharacterized protein n=1 Tax=Trichobilharzia regenti TaxID=157069 RepID=A0AA85IPM0_TRIRE|nr:unnamed protein product [Trichobilharzia regenti]